MGDAGFPLRIWCPVSFSFILLGREKDTEFGSISSWTGDGRVESDSTSQKGWCEEILVRCRIWLSLGPVSIPSYKALLRGFEVFVLQADFDWLWWHHKWVSIVSCMLERKLNSKRVFVVTDARISRRILLRFRQPIKVLLSSLKILIKKEFSKKWKCLLWELLKCNLSNLWNKWCPENHRTICFRNISSPE